MDDVTARQEAIQRRLLARFVPENEAEQIARRSTKVTPEDARSKLLQQFGA